MARNKKTKKAKQHQAEAAAVASTALVNDKEAPADLTAASPAGFQAATQPQPTTKDPIHVDPLGGAATNSPIVHRYKTSTDTNAGINRYKLTDSQLRATLDRFGKEGNEDAVDETTRHNVRFTNEELQHQQQLTQEEPPGNDNNSNDCKIVTGAVACLCSATLGAGILSLPYAMSEAGILCGMGLLLGSAAATALSIQLLVQAMQVVYYSAEGGARSTNSLSFSSNHGSNSQNGMMSGEKTYEDLVEILLGTPARRVVEASMLFFCCGAAVAYVIAVGDILEQSGWTLSSSHSKSHRALAMTIVWLIAMAPLSLLRTMKSLECASSIGIASIATLVLAALYHYVEDQHQEGSPTTDPPTTSPWLNFYGDADVTDDSQSILEPTHGMMSILRACPIIIFAFSCQVNVCAIYDEMPGRNQQQAGSSNGVDAVVDANDEESPSAANAQRQLHNSEPNDSRSDTSSLSKHGRMLLVTWCAVGICALLYTSISIIALLDFGSTNMTPNILSSYNPESIMQVAFVGMALAVVLAYPMNIFPARVTLLGIVRSRKQQQQQQVTIANNGNENENDLAEPLLVTSPADSTDRAADADTTPANANSSLATENRQSESSSAYNDSLVEHVLATLFLTGLSLGLAIVAPNISVVFGLVGGTSSSVLGFIIPGLLGYKTAGDFYQSSTPAGSNERHGRAAVQRIRFLSVMLVIAGVLVGVVCTAVTVYSTFAVPS